MTSTCKTIGVEPQTAPKHVHITCTLFTFKAEYFQANHKQQTINLVCVFGCLVSMSRIFTMQHVQYTEVMLLAG